MAISLRGFGRAMGGVGRRDHENSKKKSDEQENLSPPASAPRGVVRYTVRIRPPFFHEMSVYQLLNKLNHSGGPRYVAVWKQDGTRHVRLSEPLPGLRDQEVVWLERA